MKKLIDFLLRIYFTPRTVKFLKEVITFISKLKTSNSGYFSLNFQLEKYMTCTHHESLIERFQSQDLIFNTQSPFEINEYFSIRYKKLERWIKIVPEYEDLKQVYDTLKSETLASYQLIVQQLETLKLTQEKYQDKIKLFFSDLEAVKSNYLSESVKNQFLQRHSGLYKFYEDVNPSELDNEMIHKYLQTIRSLNSLIFKWNKEYIARELIVNDELFSNIDGKSLDEQQRIAVLTDEDNNLILAGAGSGKTLTISGKVKFLVEKRNVNPDEILLISFTRKAAAEMQERISGKLNLNVAVKTFHQLGNEIIKAHLGAAKDTVKEMSPYVQDYLHSEIATNPVLLEKIITFFGVYLTIPKDREEFGKLGEYYESQKGMDFESLKGKLQRATGKLQTLKGETMKSIEETLIANFLFLNGVEYVYEQDYEFPTATKDFRQYKPDFYLPEYKIYIEHFGVTEKLRAPWLQGIEEEKYIKSLHWKRYIHEEKKTTLIESYSYYNTKGVLYSKLTENLEKHGVKLKKIDVQNLYEVICQREQNDQFKDFIKLICSFLNLFKSSGYADHDFDRLLERNRCEFKFNHFLKIRNELFFNICRPILAYYNERLIAENKIDFNDMINHATQIAQLPSCSFSYKYILIDEYQDISRSRFRLVKAIRDQTGAKVMCVGDDWQSIYRFTGSDLDLFAQFGEFFGKYELLRIEQTYRNSQELINIAGKFVMENKKQLTKDLKSGKTTDNPIQIIGYKQNQLDVLRNTIDTIVAKYGLENKIMLLGRNNKDVNFIGEADDFIVDDTSNSIKYTKYPMLKLSFLTAHKSKGLEAGNVILINAENKLLGFPSQISDDPVLSFVLTKPDAIAFAEERRLFYVALTRTQNELYILAPEQDKSVFVTELMKEYGLQMNTSLISSPITNNPKCLKCETGILVERKNAKGKVFLGCSNYPRCRRTYSDVRLIDKPSHCQKCGGYMELKISGAGKQFYGCSNYQYCRKDNQIDNKGGTAI